MSTELPSSEPSLDRAAKKRARDQRRNANKVARYHSDPEYRAKEKERKRLATANLTPEQRARRAETARNRYYRNHPAELERGKKYRAGVDQGKVNERNRASYARNRDQRLSVIRAGRYRRDPTRGLATLILRFKAGDVEHNELVRRFDDAIKRLNEKASELPVCGDLSIERTERNDESEAGDCEAL